MWSNFGKWLNDRGVKIPEAARQMGVPAERVRRATLALDAPLFALPKPEFMGQIYRFTGGAIGPADFYDLPELDGHG